MEALVASVTDAIEEETHWWLKKGCQDRSAGNVKDQKLMRFS